VGTSLFGRGTQVEPVGDGRFRGDLGEHWNCPIVPQGGIVAATAARAMTEALDDETQRLRSLNGVFAAPVQPGPVDIEVTTLRRGRTMSQLRVAVRSPGSDAGFDGLAVFGGVRDGFAFTDIDIPEGVKPPAECPSFRDPAPEGFERRVPFNFWEHVEGRAVIGHPPWEVYEPTTSLRAMWYRFDDPPRGDDGTWDSLAVLALCDTMPGSVSERLGAEGQARQWLPPSADFTVHVLGEARGEWLLAVNRARHAGDGYASLDMEMWDADDVTPTLVAYATQVMFFSFPKEVLHRP
jgi:acyl-CoA thioesterase